MNAPLTKQMNTNASHHTYNLMFHIKLHVSTATLNWTTKTRCTTVALTAATSAFVCRHSKTLKINFCVLQRTCLFQRELQNSNSGHSGVASLYICNSRQTWVTKVQLLVNVLTVTIKQNCAGDKQRSVSFYLILRLCEVDCWFCCSSTHLAQPHGAETWRPICTEYARLYRVP